MEMPGPTSPAVDVKPPKGKLPWLWLAVIVLLLGGIVGVWYWQQTSIDALNSKLSSLQSEKDSLTTELEQLKNPAPKLPEYTSKDFGFALTLNEDYAIVNNSMQGEGPLPFFSMLIVKVTSQTGVFDALGNSQVSLTALDTKRNSTDAAYFKSVKDSLGNRALAKLPSVTVDGAKADVYTTNGLFGGKEVFFQKEGIHYHITTSTTDAQSDKIIADVLKGFKFD